MSDVEEISFECDRNVLDSEYDKSDRLKTARTLHLSDFSGISDSDGGENTEEMFDPPNRGGLPVISSSESEADAVPSTSQRSKSNPRKIMKRSASMGTPVNTPSSSRNGTPQVFLASKSSTVPKVTPRRSNQLPDKSRSVPRKSSSASHMTPSRQVAITATAGSRDENGNKPTETAACQD